MAVIKSFSIADSEIEIYEAFKVLCSNKKTKISMSWGIIELMAKAVQVEEDKKNARG